MDDRGRGATREIGMAAGGWRLALGLVATAAGIAPGRGEVTWLQPEAPAVTPGAVLALQVVSGESFGEPFAPVLPTRIRVIGGWLADGPVAVGAPVLQTTGNATVTHPAARPVAPNPAPAANGEQRLVATLARPAVAAFTAELEPEVRTVPRPGVHGYLRKVFASEDVLEAWGEVPAPEPWREVRRIRLKTYVRVGEPSATDRSWAKAERRGLDVVPDGDPTAVQEGAELAVWVWRDGRPASGVLVQFLAWGGDREHVVASDDNGRAVSPVDAAGLWQVQAVDIRKAAVLEAAWEVQVVRLTFNARARPRG